MQLITFFLIISFQLRISQSVSSGVCVVPVNQTRQQHVLDRRKGTWVIKEYHVIIDQEACCEGYTEDNVLIKQLPSRRQKDLHCKPVCNPACVKSDCVAPDTCVCYPGHKLINSSNSTCYDVCDSCVNGACPVDSDECDCYTGYEKDDNLPHICNPVCNPPCENATCSEPGTCKCFDGFEKNEDNDNVCVPACSEPCLFGQCTAPDECTCYEGYINDDMDPSICIPICDYPCENGFCLRPNSCACRLGYRLHPRNPFKCIPDSYFNFCELNMSKAVKYDTDASCFVMKDQITVSGDARCQTLIALSQPLCNYDNCANSECLLNFKCSAKKINGAQEIHCDLEENDFETDSNMNTINTVTNWTDVLLIVNSYKNMNTSLLNIKEETKEWILKPISSWPVCGKMKFGIEISNCNPLTNKHSAINGSLMRSINVALCITFLVIVIVGVSGFLWMRHRKMNDPLNYREETMRGYQNHGYEDPVELVSDDEFEQHLDERL